MKKILAILGLTLLPLCASAGLITFNLAGDSGDGAEGAALDGLSSGNVTKGGITARLSTSDSFRLLNQTGSSFGVNLDGDGCDVSNEIDSACGNEFIDFQFDRMVTLVSITLTNYSPSDDAALRFENPVTDGTFGSPDLPSSPSTLPIGAPVGGVGDRFTIISLAGNGFSLDSFTIMVPAPATLALLGLGLLGMGYRRRQTATG